MLTLIVSLLVVSYVGAFIAAFTTLATSPSFERRITIDHAPVSIIQAKAVTEAHFHVDLDMAHYFVNPIEEKRIQYDVLHNYHI